MKRNLIWPLLFLMAHVASAQNPQTQAAPLYGVNAKYTNGVAPGYMPCGAAATSCASTSGLNLSVGPGTANCAGTIETYSGGTLTMTASATNYVYLDTSASCAPAVKTTTFTSTDIPIATVLTNGTGVTSISDDRTPFVTPGSSGSGITQLTGDVTAGPGSGSQAATLATVNSGPGVCGDSTHVCQITTDAKGRTTAQTPIAISGGGGIGDTTVSVSAGTQSSNSCSSSTNVTMTGLTTSMVVSAGYSANPASLTGWGSVGGMVFQIWPSAANTATWEVCNQTASSITYSAITFNVEAQ